MLARTQPRTRRLAAAVLVGLMTAALLVAPASAKQAATSTNAGNSDTTKTCTVYKGNSTNSQIDSSGSKPSECR